MQLSLDIGNSRRKLGLFNAKNKLAEQAIWTDWTLEQLLDWATRRGVRSVMLSTVAAPDAQLTATLQQHFVLEELTATTPLPFRNEYRTPQTLGKDRLAGVAGAQALFPEHNCLVVDAGTCLKYDLLTADGVYRGGNIAPGAAMRLQAMHHFTARLPEVPQEMPTTMVGDSTLTALQNGGLRGAALEITGFVQLFRQQVDGPLQVILTGGDADFFRPHLYFQPLVLVPHLTLTGLNQILTFLHKLR
jgi:type III pantothenate kinase